jgi:hypothetical protein
MIWLLILAKNGTGTEARDGAVAGPYKLRKIDKWVLEQCDNRLESTP